MQMKVLLTELQNIEDRITAREAEGCTHQEAELKGVEEYAIECSILKWLFLKMFKTVLMKESKSMEEWDSEDTPMESAGEMPELLVFMKVQTKSTECYL
jgi:hypothetical protein